MRSIYDMLRHKLVKVAYHIKPGNLLYEKGILMDGNDSFIVLKNREGRVQFIAIKTVVKIQEIEQSPDQV